jgi:hypothetical protein
MFRALEVPTDFLKYFWIQVAVSLLNRGSTEHRKKKMDDSPKKK